MRIHKRFLKEAMEFLVSMGTVVSYTVDETFVLMNVVNTISYKVEMLIINYSGNDYLDFKDLKTEIRQKNYSYDIYNNLVLFIDFNDRKQIGYNEKYKCYDLFGVESEVIDSIVGLDELMKPYIIELNQNGYKTISSCEGHKDGLDLLYIQFPSEYIEDELIFRILENTPIIEWEMNYIRTLRSGVYKVATLKIKTESREVRMKTLRQAVDIMLDYKKNKQE